MNILLLGGTAFLGHAIATHALASGHAVTCLARGTNQPPTDATFITADRDQPDALRAVTGTKWDAVIDLTNTPEHALRATAQLDAQHWVFVSTASVYADFSTLEPDESAPTLPIGPDYGGTKIACEQAFSSTETTIIRPGLIGGYGDWTSRSGYYPWRFAHPSGHEILVPDPSFPVALIDVEDLAAWIVKCAVRRLVGVFNATGSTTTLAEVFRICRSITGFNGNLRILHDPTLVNPWMGPKSLPLWIPDPAWRYAMTLDCSAARREGLHTRDLQTTLEAALRYESERETPRQAGLTDEEEQACLLAE